MPRFTDGSIVRKAKHHAPPTPREERRRRRREEAAQTRRLVINDLDDAEGDFDEC